MMWYLSFMSISAAVLSLILESSEAHQSFLGYLTSKETEELYPAYIIGSRWAVCSARNLSRMSLKNLRFSIGDELFDLEIIKFIYSENDGILSAYEIDLAIFKVSGRVDKYGSAFISADYPEEEDEVYAVLNDTSVMIFKVADYRDCVQVTGLTTGGAFCLADQSIALQPGAGLFSPGGLLIGLVSDRQLPGGTSPVTAIAPATAWIIDVMSEYTPR